MTFTESICVCMGKYATFEGRAKRSEYWWFYLFNMVGYVLLSIMDNSELLPSIFSLVLFIPSISAAARRLHDTGRSGWWQLLTFTIIGIPFLIYWLIIEGDKKKNSYSIAKKSAKL